MSRNCLVVARKQPTGGETAIRQAGDGLAVRTIEVWNFLWRHTAPALPRKRGEPEYRLWAQNDVFQTRFRCLL